jgi:hypothetical protein
MYRSCDEFIVVNHRRRISYQLAEPSSSPTTGPFKTLHFCTTQEENWIGLKPSAALWWNSCKILAMTTLCLQRQFEERTITEAEHWLFCYRVSSFVTVFTLSSNHFHYSHYSCALSVLCDTAALDPTVTFPNWSMSRVSNHQHNLTSCFDNSRSI